MTNACLLQLSGKRQSDSPAVLSTILMRIHRSYCRITSAARCTRRDMCPSARCVKSNPFDPFRLPQKCHSDRCGRAHTHARTHAHARRSCCYRLTLTRTRTLAHAHAHAHAPAGVAAVAWARDWTSLRQDCAGRRAGRDGGSDCDVDRLHVVEHSQANA